MPVALHAPLRGGLALLALPARSAPARAAAPSRQRSEQPAPSVCLALAKVRLPAGPDSLLAAAGNGHLLQHNGSLPSPAIGASRQPDDLLRNGSAGPHAPPPAAEPAEPAEPAAPLLAEAGAAAEAAAAPTATPAPAAPPEPEKPEGMDEDVWQRELMRRRKISESNRGKRPWNVGRKHSEETKARIRERTRQAMQRPEVVARMAAANQYRSPQTAEAKKRISSSLVKRAQRIGKILDAQADLIVSRLAASEDPADQQLGSCGDAASVIKGLAWQLYKRIEHYEALADEMWPNDPEFRDRVAAKIRRRLAQARSTRRRPSRVNLVLRRVAQLERVHKQLDKAEQALAKLGRAKEALSGDPERLRLALGAEAQAQQMIARLHKQAAELEAALAPLQDELSALQPAGAPAERPVGQRREPVSP